MSSLKLALQVGARHSAGTKRKVYRATCRHVISSVAGGSGRISPSCRKVVGGLWGFGEERSQYCRDGRGSPLKWDAGPRQTCLQLLSGEIVFSPQNTPRARKLQS